MNRVNEVILEKMMDARALFVPAFTTITPRVRAARGTSLKFNSVLNLFSIKLGIALPNMAVVKVWLREFRSVSTERANDTR